MDKDFFNKLLDKVWAPYFKHFKVLLFIPLLLLISSFATTFIQVQNTGDLIHKDISLKGGVTLTVITGADMDPIVIGEKISDNFGSYSIAVRTLHTAGVRKGYLIESDIPSLTTEQFDEIVASLNRNVDSAITNKDVSLETLGSSLGASFFSQVINALIVAFILMAIVVILYYRSFVPSIAVIAAAVTDMVVTLGIVNIIGIELGTAGIAAFLMLIGYSVDTDMLLTTRVLRRKREGVEDAVKGAFKTGLLMSLTTLAALSVALFLSQSEVIRQIMLILFIGLIVDFIATWIQNVGILLWYVEKKSK